MHTYYAPFKDRTYAGRRLISRLGSNAHRSKVLVFGLPRGGVPIAPREHVGVMALQGLIAHYGYGGDASAENAAELARWGVNLADTFIQELNQ